MKKLIFMLPLLICASNISAKGFGSGVACGSIFGFTTGMIASEMRRYQQPQKPSLYVYPVKPDVYVVPQPVQSQVVYYAQPQPVNKTIQTRIIKNESNCKECELEAKQLELQIIKEQNRKKELALKEKELDVQIFKLKQV